jgi:hypothetical protein
LQFWTGGFSQKLTMEIGLVDESQPVYIGHVTFEIFFCIKKVGFDWMEASSQRGKVMNAS